MTAGTTAPSAHDVVTFGEVMGLVLATDGPIELAARADLGCAGAEATVAVGLARLGHRAAFFGRVGNDAFGRRIVRELRGEDVDVSSVIVDPHPTGLLVRDAVTDRPITVDTVRSGSAGSRLTAEDVPVDVIRASRALHVTGITAALSDGAFRATVAACRAAVDAHVPVVFDPNVRLRLASRERWTSIIETLAAMSDVVLAGADDLRVLDPSGSVDRHDPDSVDLLLRSGPHTVVVKDGARGAVERSADGRWTSPARSVRLVDPVGAGDAFAAGWISAWLRGLPPERRLREGNAVASCAVGARGDLPGLPSASVRDAVLDDGAPDVIR